MAGTEVRPADKLPAKRVFIDVPFACTATTPTGCRHCASASTTAYPGAIRPGAHQRWARGRRTGTGKAVGRIGACIDSSFNEVQGEFWAWVGFFDAVNDAEVAGSLFDVALDWSRRQCQDGRRARPISPPTTSSASLSKASTPRPPCSPGDPTYYEQLWTGAGWEQAMDLYGTCSSGTPRRVRTPAPHPAEVA